MISVLGLNQGQAFQLYGVIGGFGPVAGVIVGGFVFDKVGGYNGPNAMPILVLVGAVSSIAAFFSVLFNDAYVVAAFMTL